MQLRPNAVERAQRKQGSAIKRGLLFKDHIVKLLVFENKEISF